MVPTSVSGSKTHPIRDPEPWDSRLKHSIPHLPERDPFPTLSILPLEYMAFVSTVTITFWI